MKQLCDCYHDTQYVSLLCMVIGLTAALVILAALLGADLLRDWRRLNRMENGLKPKRP